MTDFDIEIDRFMFDCAAKGLAVKTMKSNEQTLKIYVKLMFVNLKLIHQKM
ncbi:hypothetical protein ACQKMI_00265 [Lysinibacillus sp. NPDC097214]|uniref:hypothetical protein n=1 Tax=Lysinibacillus sp. NPDC097214 TaxID=3390584 RepID=UPI003D02A9A5